MAAWDGLIAVRDTVNAALEQARADKKIGKSLEAKVIIPAQKMAGARLVEPDALADLLIVSQAEVSDQADEIRVEPALGEKCPRCWKHSTASGTDNLCPRCAAVVAKLPEF